MLKSNNIRYKGQVNRIVKGWGWWYNYRFITSLIKEVGYKIFTRAGEERTERVKKAVE